MWFYFSEKYAALKNLKLVCAFAFYSPLTPPSANFWELVQQIGIPKEKFYIIDKPTRFARVYVPDNCFFADANLKYLYYTKEFLNLIKKLPNIPAPKHLNVEKIYFSRIAFHSIKDFNEKDIENCFKKQGFTIIYPEKNTFLENLAILQNCKVFAATDGSIAHNLLFCKNNTTAIICRKARLFTKHQITINYLINANVVYIDISFSTFLYNKGDYLSGPFFLYETNYLRNYFGLPSKFFFPFWKFFQYFIFYIINKFLRWTHPIRGKLKIRTRFKHLFKRIKNI